MHEILDKSSVTFVKFMPGSVQQIFLTPNSQFRTGFINCGAYLLLTPVSFINFHTDRLKKLKNTENWLDYRTKLTLDLTKSDNVLMTLSPTKFDINSDSSMFSLPKIIEIENYKPVMAIISSSGRILKDMSFKPDDE